jgi:hypothetical protein
VFKRLIWFSTGAVSGAAGTMYVRRRIQEKLRRFTPGGMREQALAKVKQAGSSAKVAIDEGKRVAGGYRQSRRAAETIAHRASTSRPDRWSGWRSTR